jgi:hypothetical protein
LSFKSPFESTVAFMFAALVISGISAAIVVNAAVAMGLIPDGEAAPKWTNQTCLTNDCIANTLNALTPERAAEAKLTTWGNATYVWYRK